MMTEDHSKLKRRRIFLMRHGSVTYFDAEKGKIDGRSVSLNDAGRQQATHAGQSFAGAGTRFDRVIVSGLTRTVETATHVLAATGQSVDLEVWPEFEELRSGPLEEIPVEELYDSVVGTFTGMVPEAKQFARGESIGELLDRVHGAIDRLRADQSWDTVLMVLHGGVNRAIISLALTGQRVFLGNLSQAPACINALDVGDAKHDWVVRFTGWSPSDLLQDKSRLTTLEAMLADYLKTRPDN